jgi:adenylate cyclase
MPPQVDAKMSGNSTVRVRRRLAAILVAAYGRLSPSGEINVLAELRAILSEIIEPLSADFGGNVFSEERDVALIEFESVVEATRCGAALLRAIADKNAALPEDRRMTMRIGINLGDIMIDGPDVVGDGVNVAARLVALSEPGSIYVSSIVYEQVIDKLDFHFEDIGPKELKNIKRPVRVYRFLNDAAKQEREVINIRTAAGSAGFDDQRAIAVLPFANFSGDPEQEFFADGITEDIISMLACWRAFPVIARNSTFTYKGQTVDIKKVGADLGARYVLEGSVRKSGRRVRVTAQLIRADTNHHIMAERYDRDLNDLFELQDEIVTAIAGAIQPELLKFERERVAERPQHSEDAYQLYQRGMFHHYRQNKADNAAAQEFFRRALVVDPEYPQSTAALSIALTAAAYLSWSDDPECSYREAFELGQRSIVLDARYPNAHFALALICMWTSRTKQAAAEFQEAIKLNPSFAAAHAVLGAVLNFLGDPEDGVTSVETAIRLSPSDPRLFIWRSGLAAAQYQVRNYAQAVETGRRSWALNRNYFTGLTYVVAGLAQLGKDEEARAALNDLRGLDPKLTAARTTLQLYKNQAGVDHLLEGLRKAGFE